MLALSDFTPTDEQIAITDFVRDSEANILVNAYAGSGKTTTLDLVQAASTKKPILCLAFNKRIAEEMDKRFPSTTTVRTFNSLGHRIWAKTVSSVKFNPDKMKDLLKAEIAELKSHERREASEAWFDILAACRLARSLGYIPEGIYPHAHRLISTEDFHASLDSKPTSLLIDIVDSLLRASIKAAYQGAIDFDDQIYMPALFGGTFPRFPFIMVDEVQDLSPTNHAMLDKLGRNRLCAVGDRWQSIYGFRGANTQGVERIKERFACEEFPLSISFRCPKAIVEAARWRVPDFKWVKPGGHYEVLQSLLPSRIPDGAAILCRNNAPLFRMAFGLLEAKRSVQVAGSDIGPKLIRIMSKLGEAGTARDGLLSLIQAWKAEKLATSNSPQTIVDMANCMEVFASFGSTLGQAVTYAEHLFKQQGTIKLLTGHKAKGGEWETVYHLDPWLIGDSDQELNLRYVITTRALRDLYEINLADIRWKG